MKVGDWVRTTEPEMGTAQGPTGTVGDGQPREIPVGAVCEVFSVEPRLQWATIHYELAYGGHRDPFRIEAVVDFDRLEATSRPVPVAFDVPLPPPDNMAGATPESWRSLLPELMGGGLTQAYFDVMPSEVRALLPSTAIAHLQAQASDGQTPGVEGESAEPRRS